MRVMTRPPKRRRQFQHLRPPPAGHVTRHARVWVPEPTCTCSGAGNYSTALLTSQRALTGRPASIASGNRVALLGGMIAGNTIEKYL
jgi:hypothetical protein